MKSFSLQTTKGYLCLVHPPGWKKPTDEEYKSEYSFKEKNWPQKCSISLSFSTQNLK
jgi:hypothetical protein